MYMIRDRPQKASPTVVEASRANILVENPALKFDFASYCCLMVLHYPGGLANVTIVFYDLKNPTINQAMLLHVYRTLGTSLTP